MSLNHNGIDPMRLLAIGSTEKWNAFLTKCYLDLNINRLADTLRELQVGMVEYAKHTPVTPELQALYCRWDRSIWTTANKIIKKIHPMPQDNPLIAKEEQYRKQLEVKRARDRSVEAFLRRSSY